MIFRGFRRVRVLRGLRGREVVVGDVHPRRERRRVEGRAELAEVVVALRDLPEEEVAVGADAGRRVGVQRVEARRELLDHLGEGVLRRRALLDRQPPPLGAHLEERVGDVLAARLLAHRAAFYLPVLGRPRPGGDAARGSASAARSGSRGPVWRPVNADSSVTWKKTSIRTSGWQEASRIAST